MNKSLIMYELFSSVILRAPIQSLKIVYQTIENPSSVIEEGIYLSSSVYWKELKKQDKLNAIANQKIKLTYLKYWIRSCTRPTPYGTFAGTAILKILDDSTDISLNENSKHTRILRLDMNCLAEIIKCIIELPYVRNHLKFYPNNTIYRIGDQIRYVEYSLKNNMRVYELMSVAASDELESAIKFSKKGVTISELSYFICQQTGEDISEVSAFVSSLISDQLLFSELEPTVTGDDPLGRLISQISKFDSLDILSRKIVELKKLIDLPLQSTSNYQQIDKCLAELDLNLDISKNTIQADLSLSLAKDIIERQLVQEILNQTEDIFALSIKIKNPELSEFIKRFIAKYESMEVPISLALDSELGIGYAQVNDSSVGGSELINHLVMERQQSNISHEINHVHDFALKKYLEYLKSPEKNITIQESELVSLKKLTAKFKFANSMYIMGNLFKGNSIDENISANNFLFAISGCSGPSAANLIGRFTHCNENLYQVAKSIINLEEAEFPDVIFAEVVHLPQARIGNVILRPLLRNYEIPYMGVSGANANEIIPIDDITVSIKNGEIFLKSVSLNKRIIPRLTTAHRFSQRSLPIYKFLCDLQSQGLSQPVIWDWGQLGQLKHLPRVCYKNLILRKAQWSVEEKDINNIPNNIDDKNRFIKSFQEKYSIPNRTLFIEGDNKLLIDFEQPNGIELLLHYLKRYKIIILEEFLFTDTNCVVKDQNNFPYTNELIIPIHRREKVSNSPSPIQRLNQNVTRKFSPNSEWLYFKIYTGPKTIESILKSLILPFIETGLKNKYFEKFHFVRYRDEDSHLRIRFYNTNISKQVTLQSELISLLQPSLNNMLIDKIIIDTYNREIERYGGELIENSETIFHNDSLAVLRFIDLLEGSEGEKYRMLFSLRAINMFLDDFDLPLSEKISFSKYIQESFFIEFGGSPQLQKLVNERYRKYQKDIFSHMDEKNDIVNEIYEGINIFKIRGESNKSVSLAIREKFIGDVNNDELFKLLSSYIHMFMNRLFIGNQRKYELLLYHFLNKYYNSIKAISVNELDK